MLHAVNFNGRVRLAQDFALRRGACGINVWEGSWVSLEPYHTTTSLTWATSYHHDLPGPLGSGGDEIMLPLYIILAKIPVLQTGKIQPCFWGGNENEK
jgi:hypothetical protein